jgi:hypothetical protein
LTGRQKGGTFCEIRIKEVSIKICKKNRKMQNYEFGGRENIIQNCVILREKLAGTFELKNVIKMRDKGAHIGENFWVQGLGLIV